LDDAVFELDDLFLEADDVAETFRKRATDAPPGSVERSLVRRSDALFSTVDAKLKEVVDAARVAIENSDVLDDVAEAHR
jgi:hypothetical protein